MIYVTVTLPLHMTFCDGLKGLLTYAGATKALWPQIVCCKVSFVMVILSRKKKLQILVYDALVSQNCGSIITLHISILIKDSQSYDKANCWIKSYNLNNQELNNIMHFIPNFQ